MKIWPLLITSMFPFMAYPALDNSLSEDSAYEESDEINDDEEDDEDEDFEGFYGDEDFVSISTGTKKSLAKAPSVASVITAKQIKAMGARTLSDVLSTVPGVNLSNSGQISSPKYFIRGIFSLDNPHPLFLVNGTPISSVVRGDRSAVVPSFPVGSIARVEVIRGPGSALHGADAFSGVINIITKGVGNVDDTVVGTRFGSFDTQEMWTNTAFEMGEVKMVFSVDYSTTDGHKEIIDADVQTTLDAIFGTNASLAPGPVNVGYRAFDTRFDLVYKDFNLKIGFQDRDNVGTGKGGASALDPIGKLGSERLQINLNYLTAINEDWEGALNLSHFRSNQRNETVLNLYSQNVNFGLGVFPDGLLGSPGWKETNDIVQTRFTYSGMSAHKITFGLGYREEDLYETTDANNFTGALVQVADTDFIFIAENKRDSHFAYIQDEYQLAPDWELTAGVRYDEYSDFGSTINPRLALVWATNRNLSTKFLYGSAFRAASFNETISKSNPVALGSLDLEPETIDTLEVAFNYQLNEQVHIDLNLYHFTIDYLIDFKPLTGTPTGNLTAQNAGKVKGYGLEVELNYKFSDTLKLLFNYAYQKTKDEETDDDLGGAPNSQLYGSLNWQFNEKASFNTQISYVGEMERNSIDTRAALSASTNVIISLNVDDLYEGFGLHLRASNVFDEDIRHPSNGPTAGSPIVAIPNDLPQGGRALYLGVNKTF